MSNHPTWDLVLNHLGQDLNHRIPDNTLGVKTGAEYLTYWAATVYEYPRLYTPYLFFYGEPETGKSIFHHALHLIFGPTLIRADRPLVGPFNSELEFARIAVLEETKELGKLVNYVADYGITIARMMHATITIPNRLHWIQCSEDYNDAPLCIKGDTTVIKTSQIKDRIPFQILRQKLQEERGYFMYHLSSLNIVGDDGYLPPLWRNE